MASCGNFSPFVCSDFVSAEGAEGEFCLQERNLSMTKTSQQQINDLCILTRSVFVDLPLTGIQWQWGVGKKAAVTETAWKGYDAGVRLATAAIDNLYRMPLTAEVLNRAAPALLRWQRINNAITGALFTGLWQTVGLPTTVETRALREAVAHLAGDVRLQRQENETLIGLTTRLVQALEAEPSVMPPSMFNGFVLNEQVLQRKTKPATYATSN
jgi:hypothetical protein